MYMDIHVHKYIYPHPHVLHEGELDIFMYIDTGEGQLNIILMYTDVEEG